MGGFGQGQTEILHAGQIKIFCLKQQIPFFDHGLNTIPSTQRFLERLKRCRLSEGDPEGNTAEQEVTFFLSVSRTVYRVNQECMPVPAESYIGPKRAYGSSFPATPGSRGLGISP